MTYTWDAVLEAEPRPGDIPRYGDDKIRRNSVATRERLAAEHLIYTSGAYDTQANHGIHRPGSAVAYYQAAEPTTLPNGTALGNDTLSKGRLWVDSDTGIIFYWNGTAWTPVLATASSDPIGTVKGFSGAFVDNSTIPGWYIADGTDGTPNLINKYLRWGATSGGTGGADTATLAEANVPSHTHTGPSHQHLLLADGAPGGGGYPTSAQAMTKGRAAGGVSDYVMTAATTDAVLGLSSAAGTGNTGTGSGSATAFSILNTYYALVPIIRVS